MVTRAACRHDRVASYMADSTSRRRVAHLDMDAFFASVELLRYPELKGLPMVVGGRTGQPQSGPDGERIFARMRGYAGRGVVTTSTYEARALGVFSAMPMMKAAALAPDAFRLPGDFARYRDYSQRFKRAVRQLAPAIEDRGIDEIYIDLSDHEGSSFDVAEQIRAAVYEATGLTCSIGVAPNKLLAKIASELNKPNGTTVFTHDQIQRLLWPLPASKINGIGPKATVKLAALGIQTVGDLAAASPGVLQQRFGLRYARWLLRVAHGKDDRPVVTQSEPKSISRETTFERDLHVVRDRQQLSTVFLRLCQQLEADLDRKRCAGRTVGIKLRFDDFRTVTRDLTGPDALMTADEIHRAAGQCLKRIMLDRRIRLLGVRVSGLVLRTELSTQDETAQLRLDGSW